MLVQILRHSLSIVQSEQMAHHQEPVHTHPGLGVGRALGIGAQDQDCRFRVEQSNVDGLSTRLRVVREWMVSESYGRMFLVDCLVWPFTGTASHPSWSHSASPCWFKHSAMHSSFVVCCRMMFNKCPSTSNDTIATWKGLVHFSFLILFSALNLSVIAFSIHFRAWNFMSSMNVHSSIAYLQTYCTDLSWNGMHGLHNKPEHVESMMLTNTSPDPFVKTHFSFMQIIRMLVAVVIVFLICWLPIRILMTVITFSPTWLFIDDLHSSQVYIVSYFTCHYLAMSNSFVNPIIYSFMSKSFRVSSALFPLFSCVHFLLISIL